jgi:diaminopropionate ammonia-lyase
VSRASNGNESLVVRNAARRQAPTSPIAFHRRLPHYVPTRLVELPAVADELGAASVHVKDESARLGLPAFKILGASWATYRLLVERLGDDPEWSTVDELRAALAPLGALTLVAATDGNHGRAVARVAALLGYDAHILVPAGTAAARIEGIEAEGARVTVVDGTYDDAVAESARLADETTLVVSDTSWEGYTDVPRRVIEGYSTIFAEVDRQLDASPDLIVVQMGVGALAAAVVAHYGATATIVVVEPLTAACGLRSAEAGHPVVVAGPHESIMAGMNCGSVSLIAWPVLATGVDVFVAVHDTAAEDAMRTFAEHGIVAGETGAAGLAGLRAVANRASDAGVDVRGARVLLVCTEGATDPVSYERIVGRAP